MSAAAVATPPTAQPAIAGTVVCGDSAERTPADAASQPLSIKDGNQSATGAELKRHRTEDEQTAGAVPEDLWQGGISVTVSVPAAPRALVVVCWRR